jgi:predicted transcriptional regulator with HTH domain
MTRATTQRDILQVLQESYPEALHAAEIARRAGYSDDTVRENLRLMDTVMHDLRYKIPRWRPKHKYIKP